MRGAFVITSFLASLTVGVSGTPVVDATNSHLAERAEGTLRYTYVTADGSREQGEIKNPTSGKCIEVPGTEKDAADTPINNTDENVILYKQKDCRGDIYLLKPGQDRSSRLKVRSVAFVGK